MRVIPAVDLRDGACVQLVGGSYAEERVRLPDPEGVVASWLERYETVHVVDLDAATGNGSNAELVDRMLGRWPQRLQVGGGIRTAEQAGDLLQRGAARVMAGTRALTDRPWLRELAEAYPGRVVPALDVRDDAVVVDGWRRALPEPLADVLAELEPLDLAGLLVTAVHREGALAGPDLDLMARLRRLSRQVLIASGGIRNAGDADALAATGVEECVVGMAMYTGGFGVLHTTEGVR